MNPRALPPPADDQLEALVACALERLESDGEEGLAAFCAEHAALAERIRAAVRRCAGLGLLRRDPGDSAFPRRLGDFRLLRRLGGGGMGVVYLARQESLGREVALKVIRPELLFFEGARERFRREVEAVARLQHPGIAPVLAVGTQDGVPWFAMERIPGRTLEEVLVAVHGRPPATLSGLDLWQAVQPEDAVDRAMSTPEEFTGNWVETVVRLLLQVADAIRHTHLRGIVHRDIKPSNIMATPHGRAMVLDFGLAHVTTSHRLTHSGATLGSPAYMSPEQIRGEAVDERTDVYSVGATLYHALTLEPPFAAGSEHEIRERVLRGKPVRPRAINPAIPPDLERVVMAAMDQERGRRHPDMVALIHDLRAVRERKPIQVRPPGAVIRGIRWLRARPGITALLAATLLVGLLVPPVLLLQQQQANRALDQARRLAEANLATAMTAVDRMLVRVSEESLDEIPGLIPVRQKLLEDALGLLEGLLARQPEDASLLEFRARTLHRIAGVLEDMGRIDDSRRRYQEGLELWRRLGPLQPAQQMWALTARYFLARMEGHNGNPKAAEAGLREAAEGLSRLVGHPEFGQRALQILAEVRNNQSLVAKELGQPELRERFLREAIAIKRHLASLRPLDLSVQQTLAIQLINLGALLAERDRQEAEHHLREAIAILEPMPNDPADVPNRNSILADALRNLGSLQLDSGQLGPAERSWERALSLSRATVERAPQIARFRSGLGCDLSNLALLRERQGRNEEALELTEEAIRQQRQALENAPQHRSYREFLFRHLCTRADALRALSQWRGLADLGAELAALPEDPRGPAYGALVLLIAAEIAGRDAEHAAEVQGLLDRAFEYLCEADRRGLAENELPASPQWALLRERPGYATVRQRIRQRD